MQVNVGDVFSGLGNVMGTEAATLAHAIEWCHEHVSVVGPYRIHEMMEGRYPDIPAELTRLVASTTLYCRYPRRTEREIYEGMGLEPGGNLSASPAKLTRYSWPGGRRNSQPTRPVAMSR